MEFLQKVIQLYAERKEWFLDLFAAHVGLALTAAVSAGIIGLLLGIFISEHKKAAGPVLTIANIGYTIPAISLLGMLIPVLGIGDKTAITALTIYGIMPMVRNTYAGITGVGEEVVAAAEGMGSTRFQIMTKIKLPLAAGVIIAGVRNMVVMTISVSAIASFIGAGGLGVAIYRGITIYDSAMTFCGSFLIALLAIVSDLLLGLLRLKKITALFLTGALILSMAGCAGNGSKDKKEGSAGNEAQEPVKIATKPMTEQFILGEMLKKLIEEKAGYEVELTKGIGGGTSNIQPAMEKGEFDLYPEYTSSGWILVLGHKAGEVSDDKMLAKLQEEYEEKFDMTWVGLYGQNNTYAVVVREDTAKKYNLETCSDLAAVSDQLVFGGNPDYIERADGLPGMSAAYGFQFKEIKDIDIGLKYQALRNGDIDVTNGYTTDAQISQDDVRALKDDKSYQVNYFCSTVVRKDALEKYPKLKETLELMDGILTDQKMAELNYQVEEEGRDEAEVAEEFLKTSGLL